MPIDPTAQISSLARVPASSHIGPFCVIGAEVELGEDCRLESHVVIDGPTVIGAGNHFFPFSTVGVAPQDLSYKGEPTRLEMGDNNTVREFCSIHRGTVKGGGLTRIGSRNLLMAYTHIAHDCMVGNDCIFANAATLGGHVSVGDFAAVGAFSPVHQFVRVGRHAYIGGGTVVTQDVLPFSKTSASRENAAYGPNKVGLERRGFTSEQIRALSRAFRSLHMMNTSQALEQIQSEPLSNEVRELVEFIQGSERGFIK